MQIGRAAIADTSLADPFYQVDIGGGRHPGAGQGDVSSGPRQQMGLIAFAYSRKSYM
jgi:hypothetical protein